MTRPGRQGAGPSDRTPGPIPEQRAAHIAPTIGLLTALPIEFVTTRALIRYPAEQYIEHDPAPYVLGKMPSRSPRQDHRVVLTQLGATATNAAAEGCVNLIRSFPTVSIVIMVGVAAGVPNPQRPNQHVRLGDIVVAQDVVDYDHIWALEHRTELRRSFPAPSARLVRCVDQLIADELSGTRPWDEWMRLPGNPVLARYCRRPSESTDVVLNAVGQRLAHPRRDFSGHLRGVPKVHFGRIGSADRSLSDVTTRDQLAARHGLLALEMEGAGIGSAAFLNNLEWFVVRGISDYGDSRRDTSWRPYASLAAAAYVRALLAKSPLIEPRNILNSAAY